MDVEKLKLEIASGPDIEEILQDMNWQEFEQTTSEILKKHRYETEINVWFTADRRFEIDVVAEKLSKVLCIDCKKWGMRKGKTTALKYAVDDQIERAEKFKEKKEIDKKIYPVIITFLQENIEFEKEVPIVPVGKLNSFLINLQKNKGELYNC